jgi:hypothetical protein
MTYISVKDLKKPKMVREALSVEHQLILTKDGAPFALMVEVTPDNVEESLREVRRAMFSAVVTKARRKGRVYPVSETDIEREVAASRVVRPAR